MDKLILGWANVTKGDLLRRLFSMGLDERLAVTRVQTRIKFIGKVVRRAVPDPPLVKSLGYSLKKENGEIVRVAFLFARHGIFLDRGVGYGRPVGSAAAKNAEKPWLRQEIAPAVESLADILEEDYADIAAASLVVTIPGIYQGKVTGLKKNKPFDSFEAALEADIRIMRGNWDKTRYKSWRR